MKTAKYKLLDGSYIEVEYDPDEPCWNCEEPVISASMGGTAICPWCDMGIRRDGKRLTFDELVIHNKNYVKNLRAQQV